MRKRKAVKLKISVLQALICQGRNLTPTHDQTRQVNFTGCRDGRPLIKPLQKRSTDNDQKALLKSTKKVLQKLRVLQNNPKFVVILQC